VGLQLVFDIYQHVDGNIDDVADIYQIVRTVCIGGEVPDDIHVVV
jgi:hypothetical protein